MLPGRIGVPVDIGTVAAAIRAAIAAPQEKVACGDIESVRSDLPIGLWVGCLICRARASILHVMLHHRDMLDVYTLLLARIAASHQAPHSAAEPPHSLFDLLLAGISKAEAQLLLPAAIDVERLAYDKGHAFAGRLAQQRARAQ